MTTDVVNEVIKKICLAQELNGEQLNQAWNLLIEPLIEVFAAGSEEIDLLFNIILEEESYAEAYNVFCKLFENGKNPQIIDVFSKIVLSHRSHPLNKYISELAVDVMGILILRGKNELITQAIDLVGKHKESYFAPDFFHGLMRQKKTDLIQPTTDAQHSESIVEILLKIENGKGIGLLWQMYESKKLLHLPLASIDPASFSTTRNYFQYLVNGKNNYKLFQSLVEDPELISKVDEQGNTLLGVYTDMYTYHPITGKLLAFCPNLDVCKVNENGHNALHLGVIAQDIESSWWYHEHFLVDLLTNPKAHLARNQTNIAGYTPLQMFLKQPEPHPFCRTLSRKDLISKLSGAASAPDLTEVSRNSLLRFFKANLCLHDEMIVNEENNLDKINTPL